MNVRDSASALPPAAAPGLSRGPVPWVRVGRITVIAILVFLGMRWLPTGTNLSHMDFRVDPKAGNAIEFCDPLNPQFIPVVAARSPVTLALTTAEPPVAGRPVRASLVMRTGSGKPVAPEDLLVTHTRRLHLLLVDPTLTDYQHVHPEPGRGPGEWTFGFTPRVAGLYRVFSDFTPAATGRGLYASVDRDVGRAPEPGAAGERLDSWILAAKTGEEARSPAVPPPGAGGYRFALTPASRPVRAGQPVDLTFAVTRDDGGAVPLLPVMDALAHLVAFDEGRSGFAHLHPADPDPARPPDVRRPVLAFKLTIPAAGRYVIWAQINLGGRETFVPFNLDVVP
jgi:hypothetical protein